MPRKNKSKKEIVHDIKTVQNVERMRTVIRKSVYPFLLELNNTIGFTKIFLQTCATAVDTTFNNQQRTQKVKDILPNLEKVFYTEDKKTREEHDKYINLFKLMEDETIHDFSKMIQSLPRVIEQSLTQENDKKPILELNVDKILG